MYPIGYTTLLFWSPVLFCGAYIGYLEHSGIKDIWAIKWQWGLFLFPIIIITYLLWDGNYNGNIYYTYRLVGGILIIILCSRLYFKPYWFEQFAMFLFLFHWPLRLFSPFIPVAESFSLVRPIWVLVLCTIVGWSVKRFAPKVYSLLTGNRG